MPRYFYALDDDLPIEEAGEELPDDEAACELAELIERELGGKGRHVRKPFRVAVYNDRRARISRPA